MGEPEKIHPVTKKPWDCACSKLTAEECYRARYPSARFVEYGDYDYETCECSCHDWEGEQDEDAPDSEEPDGAGVNNEGDGPISGGGGE